MLIYTHVFLGFVLVLIGPRSSDTPVIVSICNMQILVAKYHSPIKEINALWRNS